MENCAYTVSACGWWLWMVLLLRLECERKGTIFYAFKLGHFVVIWNVGKWCYRNAHPYLWVFFLFFFNGGNSKHIIFCSSHIASISSSLDFSILQTMSVRKAEEKQRGCLLEWTTDIPIVKMIFLFKTQKQKHSICPTKQWLREGIYSLCPWQLHEVSKPSNVWHFGIFKWNPASQEIVATEDGGFPSWAKQSVHY